MRERHIRNIPALSEEDMDKLAESHVLIAGCGGLGGNIIENLARVGVGKLTVVDGDTFTDSNLNRQILSTSDNLGCLKAEAAAARVNSIDPEIEVRPVCEFITKENAVTLMTGVDLVVDALDSVEARLILEDAAEEAGLTIIHGAIRGWDLQAMVVPPGSRLLHELYYQAPPKTISTSLSFTPAACASIESALAVRCLCGRATPLDGKLLTGSLKEMDFDIIQFGD
ncbi:MAG: HesA/MoeB/ThiF family protein [Mogibacterium sp.]|nr:HesA/MoeB/ThiF family protein [Mogibacterium sp.]